MANTVELNLEMDEITLLGALVAKHGLDHEMASILDYVVDDGLKHHDAADIGHRVETTKAMIEKLNEKLSDAEDTFY